MELEEMEPTILKSEVESALKSFKIIKLPVSDEITAELIKTIWEKGIDVLTLHSNMEPGIWPTDWCDFPAFISLLKPTYRLQQL